MLPTKRNTTTVPHAPAMTQRAATWIAIALLLFCAATAVVAARTAHAATSPAPAPPTAQHIYAVYPGPVPVATLESVEAWWNKSGADVGLTVASSPQTAMSSSSPTGPSEEGSGRIEDGVTEMSCDAPCRPAARETITLSTIDSTPERTLAHELGHSMGLAHSHAAGCQTMAPVQLPTCPTQLPWRMPAADRDALIAIWGPAPTITTATTSRRRNT